MATTTTSARTRILERVDYGMGCGGFLNPPGHPEHTACVITDLNRRPHNRGMVSLSYASRSEWVHPTIRARAAMILAAWKPAPLESEPMVAWRRKVLGYFRSCYVRPYGSRRADDLVIRPGWDPLANAHTHAGVEFIREFFPNYVPSREDFDQARWGS